MRTRNLVLLLIAMGVFVCKPEVLAQGTRVPDRSLSASSVPASKGEEGSSAPGWLTYASAVTATASLLLTFANNRRTALRSMRPVLVIVYREDGWYIKNVGNGPALDVLFARRRPNGEWFDPRRIPPLTRDGEVHLTWTDHDNVNSFGACYSDIEGRRYTSTCANDLTTIANGRKLPVWTEAQIRRHWHKENGDEAEAS